MNYVLITGCARTGTTLMARWLEEASDAFCTR